MGPEPSRGAEVCLRVPLPWWLVSTKGQPHDQPSSAEPGVILSGLPWPRPFAHWMAAIAPHFFVVVVVVGIRESLLSVSLSRA